MISSTPTMEDKDMIDKELREKLLVLKKEEDLEEILLPLYLAIHKEIYDDEEIRSVLCKVFGVDERKLADVFLHNGPPLDIEE